MSELTKQALKVENNQSFPNNNAGLITPSALRTFNEDMIDSTVNQASYTADSASFNSRIDAVSGSVAVNTGSLLVTASFNNGTRNLTFTKGDNSTFAVNIPDASGSILPSGVVSGSSQIDYPFISNIPAGIVSGAAQVTPLLPTGVVSGSSQITPLLPSGVVSGSSQVSYPGLSNIPAGIVSGSSQISYPQISNIPSGIVSGSSQIILQDTTGLLSGSRIDGAVTSSLTSSLSNQALDVVVNVRNNTGAQINKGTIVRIIGATGDQPLIQTASWDNDSTSANTLGWVLANIPNGDFGRVVTQGILTGVNTDPTLGYAAGQVLYLSSSGQYTNVIPPAPFHEVRLGQVLRAQQNNGSVFVQVQNGYELGELHDVNITTSSLANNNVLAYNSTSGQWVNQTPSGLGVAMTGSNNTFSGTQTFNNIVVNGTASIAYLESVTGSAKIIGDAFIILNNDTPTERYAGIIVLDSGSAGTSASFQFDGLTNDWFYEYTGSDPLNFGVVMFGPEYGTKGSPTYLTNNRLPKGDGGHHLNDSNISDDGSNVSINSNTQITGSLLINGNAPLINSDLTSLNNFTQSQQSVNTNLNAFTSSASDRLNNIELTTASLQTQINGLSSVTGSYVTTGSFNAYTQSTDGRLNNIELTTASLQVEVDNLQSVTGSYATTGSNTFNGDQIVNGNSKQTFNAPAADTQVDIAAVNGANIDGTSYTNVFFGMQDYPSSGDQYKDAFVFDYWTDFNYTTGSEFIVSPKRIGGTMLLSGSVPGDTRTGISQLRDLGGKTFLNQYANLMNIGAVQGITNDQILIGNGGLAFLRISSLKNEITGSQTIISGSGGLQVTGSVDITGTFTASLQQGYVWVGDTNGRTTTVSTGSFGGGGAAFPFTGDAQISGSLGVTGSMSGFVNTLSVSSQTASVNFNDGNMFVITLPTGSVTHFTPSNIKAGQTINIQISQAASATTGSVTFSPNVRFAGGNDYQATATGSAIDLLTFVSLDGTNVLGTSIKNFL